MTSIQAMFLMVFNVLWHQFRTLSRQWLSDNVSECGRRYFYGLFVCIFVFICFSWFSFFFVAFICFVSILFVEFRWQNTKHHFVDLFLNNHYVIELWECYCEHRNDSSSIFNGDHIYLFSWFFCFVLCMCRGRFEFLLCEPFRAFLDGQSSLEV